MARTHKILNESAPDTSDIVGDQIVCHHQYDEAGAVQYIITTGTAAEIQLQGRLSSELSWIAVATSGALDASGTADVLQTGVAVLPYMRAVLKSPSSGAVVKVFFME